jgi:hypothetical protein
MKRFLVSLIYFSQKSELYANLLAATDWDGSDGEYDGSSEPMDSIAELGDVDAQL